MARVFLPRVGGNPYVDLVVDEFERLADRDRFGVHKLVDSPEKADIVLFAQCNMVDWRLRAIRGHPIARRFWSKSMVYDTRDTPWRSLPGVYVSTPANRFDSRCQRAWGYLTSPAIEQSGVDPDLLFSFVGGNTSACRFPLFGLRHRDAIVEEVAGFVLWDSTAPNFRERRTSYAQTMNRSRFVLCPRGRGTSSIRLYETLAAGRVPVIISDDWIPPEGPDWDACSIRWPEGQVVGLTELLEERSSEWPKLSRAAARAYQEFFAPTVAFHRIADLCSSLRESVIATDNPARLAIRSYGAAASQRLAQHFGHR